MIRRSQSGQMEAETITSVRGNKTHGPTDLRTPMMPLGPGSVFEEVARDGLHHGAQTDVWKQSKSVASWLLRRISARIV